MTSFQWKRKRALTTSAAAAFSNPSEADELEVDSEESVDWLTATKRRRLVLLEDSKAKSKRLMEEGATLAESGRYWEAMKYWNEAIEIDPGSAPLQEMKSQALMEVGEVFPAVQSAERAVRLDPTSAVARQTLGRAQLGIGEVHMALQSFQKALHLDPLNTEVREEDLKWAQELVRQRDSMKEQLAKQAEAEQSEIRKRRRKVDTTEAEVATE